MPLLARGAPSRIPRGKHHDDDADFHDDGAGRLTGVQDTLIGSLDATERLREASPSTNQQIVGIMRISGLSMPAIAHGIMLIILTVSTVFVFCFMLQAFRRSFLRLSV